MYSLYLIPISEHVNMTCCTVRTCVNSVLNILLYEGCVWNVFLKSLRLKCHFLNWIPTEFWIPARIFQKPLQMSPKVRNQTPQRSACETAVVMCMESLRRETSQRFVVEVRAVLDLSTMIELMRFQTFHEPDVGRI